MATAAQRMRKYRARKGVKRAINHARQYGICRSDVLRLVDEAFGYVAPVTHALVTPVTQISLTPVTQARVTVNRFAALEMDLDTEERQRQQIRALSR